MMKKYLLLTFFFNAFIFSKAQTKVPPPPPPAPLVVKKANQKNDVVFTQVETEAKFNGGDTAWRNFLVRNLNVNDVSEKLVFPKGVKTIKQTAIVKFIVCTDGTLCNIEVENKVHPLIRAEAIRVLSKSPNWKPAMQNGKVVKAYRRQLITFLFDNE
jgi:periplasmic protein TonB